MSDPKKHHYVPEVYLQRFAMNQSGDLITIKVKANPGKKVKPRKRNKSQVCYLPNEYRYETEYYQNMAGTIDPNIIEKKAFEYENERLTSLFDKIDRSKKLNRSNTIELIKILIHLKKRNPVFRKLYQDFKDFDSLIREVINDYRFPPDLQDLPEDLRQYCLDVSSKILSDNFKQEQYRNDLYRSTLHDRNSEIEESNKKFIQSLLNWNITVFRTDTTVPFITCDNPGFTCKRPFNITNTNFDYIDFFAFPLSPTSLIHFSKPTHTPSNKLLIQPPIKYRKASPSTVLLFNLGTMVNASSLVFSASEDQLIIALKFLKSHGKFT